MEKIQSQSSDIIIVDIMLPYFSGLEITGKVKQSGLSTPVIVISAMGRQAVVDEAIKLGAADYITKPFNINVLNSHKKTYGYSSNGIKMKKPGAYFFDITSFH